MKSGANSLYARFILFQAAHKLQQTPILTTTSICKPGRKKLASYAPMQTDRSMSPPSTFAQRETISHHGIFAWEPKSSSRGCENLLVPVFSYKMAKQE